METQRFGAVARYFLVSAGFSRLETACLSVCRLPGWQSRLSGTKETDYLLFSPVTRETRVRFPVSHLFFADILRAQILFQWFSKGDYMTPDAAVSGRNRQVNRASE